MIATVSPPRLETESDELETETAVVGGASAEAQADEAEGGDAAEPAGDE